MPKKVIIVEDDPYLGPLMMELCVQNDLESILLKDGVEAISFFSKNNIPGGMAFIDFHMPRACGDKVLEFLEGQSFCGLKKVYLFTSMPKSEYAISQICKRMTPYEDIFYYLQKDPGLLFEKLGPILMDFKALGK